MTWIFPWEYLGNVRNYLVITSDSKIQALKGGKLRGSSIFLFSHTHTCINLTSGLFPYPSIFHKYCLFGIFIAFAVKSPISFSSIFTYFTLLEINLTDLYILVNDICLQVSVKLFLTKVKGTNSTFWKKIING